VSAATVAGAVRDGALTITEGARWHLRLGHRPPVDPVWLGPAIDAIEAIGRGKHDAG
jgi:hypothetical protein